MQTRIERFGEWDDVLAENVHYGDQSNITGTNIVVDWIIDSGGTFFFEIQFSCSL